MAASEDSEEAGTDTAGDDVAPALGEQHDVLDGHDTLSSFADVVASLRADGVELVADVERQRIEIPVPYGPRRAALLIRWEQEKALVQVIHALPFGVPAERASAVESVIVRLNHSLAVPGFGMNPASRLCYFRVYATLRDDGTLGVAELRRLCKIAASTAREYGHFLSAVAVEGQTADQSLGAMAPHTPVS